MSSKLAMLEALDKLDKLDQILKTMYSSLSNVDNSIPANTAIKILEVIPVIGTVLTMITNGDDGIVEKIDEILDILKKISARNEDMMSLVNDILLKINFLPTDNFITHAAAHINSCSKDREYLLNHPQSQQAREDLLKCSKDIKVYVRSIEGILKGERFSVDSTKLFEHLKNKDGSCNGTRIVDTYTYLFGLLFDGCQTLIMREKLSNNGTSERMLTECSEEISNVAYYYQDILKNCLTDSCDAVQSLLKQIVSENFDKTPNELTNKLLTILPWFHPFLATFSDDPEFESIGIRPPSEIILEANKTHFIVILWTPFYTNWDIRACVNRNSNRRMLATFNSKVFEKYSDGMNVFVSLQNDTDKGSIMACASDNNHFAYKPCPAMATDAAATWSSVNMLNLSGCFLLYFVSRYR